MRIISVSLIVLAFVGGCVSSRAQDATSTTVGEKLKTLIENSSLDAPGTRPWHWKIEATLYDSDGKNPQQGNIEAWYADGNMRTVLMLAGEQLTTLRIGEQLYRDSGDPTKFAQLEILFIDALHPIPDMLLDPSTTLKLTNQEHMTPKQECIQPAFALPKADTFGTDGELSYCLAVDKGQFLVEYSPSHSSTARLRLGIFQTKQIPIELQVITLGKKRIEAKTISLETYTPTPNEFDPGPEMHELGDTVEIPQADENIYMVLHKDSPHYPNEAKSHHLSGTVIFDVVIGKDGRILSKTLANNGSPVLAEAASQAFTRWVYRPYLVNGLPMKVKTKITVNFNLG